MSKPTIELNRATEVATNAINGFRAGSFSERHRQAMITHVVAALESAATIRARDSEGRFIPDDPSTPQDESRVPLNSKNVKAAAPQSSDEEE